MKKTRRLIIFVFFFQCLIAAAFISFAKTLIEVVAHNIIVNSLIVGVLVTSLVYSIYSAIAIFHGSEQWKKLEADFPEKEPTLRGALRSLTGRFLDLGYPDESRRKSVIGALRELLEWRGRMLDYASGLLIGLGLLGTFVGLMSTMAGIKQTMDTVANAGGRPDAGMLISGLTAPLGGMSTAFSASMMGLVASLVVGGLAQFLSRASNAWVDAIEEWTHLRDQPTSQPFAMDPASARNDPVIPALVKQLTGELSGVRSSIVDAHVEHMGVVHCTIEILTQCHAVMLAQNRELHLARKVIEENSSAHRETVSSLSVVCSIFDEMRVQLRTTAAQATDAMADAKVSVEWIDNKLALIDKAMRDLNVTGSRIELGLRGQKDVLLSAAGQMSSAVSMMRAAHRLFPDEKDNGPAETTPLSHSES